MRLLVYKIINNLGYNIYNKKSEKKKIANQFEKYNIKVHNWLLYQAANYIIQFENKLKDFNIEDGKKGLLISFEGLKLELETKEEFLILNEVFIKEDYSFELKDDCIVLDIGANVGFSSLYFSRLNNVIKIFSYEPVKDTFNAAEKNLDQNNISKKATLFNFGLGGKERKEAFFYKHQAKGNSGLRGKLSPSYENSENCETRIVEIKKASEVLETIFRENALYKKVLKIDCEGAEYEIIEDLVQADMLKKVDIIMMEWHDYGPEILEKRLVENNFTVFSKGSNSKAGMIYAVNHNNR